MTARTHSAGAFRALAAAFLRSRRAGDPGIWEQVSALPRLVAATLRGRYPGTTVQRLGLMALAVAYVVSPVDLVPEGLLLMAGFADDALVLAWLAGAVLEETNAFLRWEGEGEGAAVDDDARAASSGARRGETVEGHVVV
ncbi:YkvA family protein [Pseudokineococcus sp. 1T1Z-3]|uniref:YkvA family protein n=1 Tax=Pseudokineococcus sp. 1T1Z-3 TaxID=3132745 RepID=UPI0030B2862A